jgi:hypothetical protein
MKAAFALSALFSVVATALPGSIISERALTVEENQLLTRATCPQGGTLPKGFLAPTRMIPISQNLPNLHFPDTSLPITTPNDFCTIFNLEVPPSALGKNCSLEFLFPNHPQTLSPYVFSGPGHFTFHPYAIGFGGNDSTTFADQPPPFQFPIPPQTFTPGHAYVIDNNPCGIPQTTKSTTVSGAFCSPDTSLSYLQGSNFGCPIGFYLLIL